MNHVGDGPALTEPGDYGVLGSNLQCVRTRTCMMNERTHYFRYLLHQTSRLVGRAQRMVEKIADINVDLLPEWLVDRVIPA